VQGLGATQTHAIFYKDWSGTRSTRTGPPKLVGSSHRYHQDWPARSRLQDLTGRNIRNPGSLHPLQAPSSAPHIHISSFDWKSTMLLSVRMPIEHSGEDSPGQMGLPYHTPRAHSHQLPYTPFSKMSPSKRAKCFFQPF